MSRKDYELIAQALRESYEQVRPEMRGAVIDAIERVALALQQDNPRFAIARFRAAAYEDVDLGRSA